jgi:hypothetical protein
MIGVADCGRVAQLGEHLLCKQGVTGSIPVTSTTFSLFAKDLLDSSLLQSLSFGPDCARTVHERGYCTATVHIGAVIRTSAATGAISLARRLSFPKASRFICNFIWEYFYTS